MPRSTYQRWIYQTIALCSYVLLFCLFTKGLSAQTQSEMDAAVDKFESQLVLLERNNETQQYHMQMLGLMRLVAFVETQKKAHSSIDDDCGKLLFEYWADIEAYIDVRRQDISPTSTLSTSTFQDIQKGIGAISEVGLRRIKTSCPERVDGLAKLIDAMNADIKDAWEDSIVRYNADLSIFRTTTQAISNMKSALKSLNGYKGASTFSYSSNQLYNHANNLNQYNFLLGLKLDKNVYPGEFNFNGQIGLNVNGNQFDESISNIFFSYDHDISSEANPLRREVFGFVARTSNSYLNLAQRYEIGGGLVLNLFSKTITPKGNAVAKQYKPIEKLELQGDQIIACSDQACQLFPTFEKIDTNDVKAIKALHRKMVNTNRKRFARWRGGLLMGMTLEFEEYNTPSTIEVQNIAQPSITQEIPTPFAFSPKNTTRLEFRPFVEANFSDKFIFKLKPYIFIPANLSKLKVSQTNHLGQEVERYDIRYLVQGSISVKAHPVTVGLSMTYNDDRLPSQFNYLDATGTYGAFYETPMSHLFSRITFRYAFE